MKSANFARFQIKKFLLEALSDKGITHPTEIQERLIPAIRNGKDVIGQSQTGTGKTLAFLLPIVDRIEGEREEVQAVITAPTRELAGQIFEELQALLRHVPHDEEIRAKLIVGGTDRSRTLEKLRVQPQIVVGTPGRISDLVHEQALNVYTATMLVVDEADQMLDMGFIEDVDKVAARMAENLQMMVFSATIPEKLKPFLKKYMNEPRHVHVQPKQATANLIEHRIVPLRHRDKLEITTEVASVLNPFLAIVFTNTKEQADELADAMLAAGLNVERLHGGLQPRQRKQVMKRVKNYEVQYLVATDLAARGIDIKGVSHIINYSLPKDLDFYVHRVGRTARAGADGIALTIFAPEDEQAVHKLMKRGIQFTYYDLKKGEWQKLDKPPLGVPGEKRRKEDKGLEAPIVKKAKKVKPGYKKKARLAQADQQRRQRRLNRKKK
ncbi:DEAD/DEAH box helicase [Halalkalibacterium halodurans]|uniref:ATP-dependent RNA helicase n=3 Tax=Halalkalibacterium halodurans TaxID=86665 RepID=Q9KD34_HALH5|nr:DEAD/DEAH box helicase [Halalkalibacterium halodurans]MED4081785.1 DEAD/DEAH box helicase [Halalkalibacterium halodurans]MED4087045.1 DEAD/DEAH box helicase [Halalkalibacterium halodurans]MED4103864.1 DEAD/DEAH box helicase [Halalkalibacterium halodurans]MED4110880.1 DEAD/DEAH box helicase [Halalkalibacterium halodurans]MED4124839.1 DEAD/DEAH box helicase [Halalkalibacterium halodurans]